MSLDIDWSLLTDSTTSSLSDNLISALNTQLNQTSRPSFLGAITVTSFDFGTVAPEVEIKDVRDVWRAFDEGDDEGDALEASPPSSVYSHPVSHSVSNTHSLSNTHSNPYSHPQSHRRPTRGRHGSAPVLPTLSTRPHFPGPASAINLLDDEDMDDVSVHSGFHSGRNSVASVGLGHVLRRHPLVPSPSTPPRLRNGFEGPPPSPPASPPTRPAGDRRADPLPSVQIHLRLDHASNMSLTLLTSLQVNYPSPLFMALPLKLVITGLTLAADVVLAYSGSKNRVHISIVDTSDDPPTPGIGGHGQGAGQRILPNLHIESEIGSADTHVLRNVGKVERFIVDAVRKTLVDELLFPNFQTIVL